MSTFPELRAAKSEQDGERITLPIGGVKYSFSKSIPMRLGMALALARTQAEEMAKAGKLEETPPALVGLTDAQMMRAMIGDQWDRMLDDDVEDTEFEHVYHTLFAWHMAGEDVARQLWKREIGREGDARPPASSASTARKTSPRSSTRKTSVPSRRRRSPGTTSSSTGTTSKRTSTASTE